MEQTKQLPAPSAPALPLTARWQTPILGSVAEVLARLADSCLHPLIILPLFFAVSGDTFFGLGRAVALILAAGYLASAAILPLASDHWPRLRLGALVALTLLPAVILLGLGRATGWLETRRYELTGSALVFLIIATIGLGAVGTLRLAVVGIVRAEGSWRTRWGRWTVLGIVGTLAGGFLTRDSLLRAGDLFPTGFARFFTLAGLALLIAAIALAVLLALEWRRRANLPWRVCLVS